MKDGKIIFIRQNQRRNYWYEASFLCAMQAYTNIKRTSSQFITEMKSVGKFITLSQSCMNVNFSTKF